MDGSPASCAAAGAESPLGGAIGHDRAGAPVDPAAAVGLWELRERPDYHHFRDALIEGYTGHRSGSWFGREAVELAHE